MKAHHIAGIAALIVGLFPFMMAKEPLTNFAAPSMTQYTFGGLLVIATIVLWLVDNWKKY